MGEKIVKINEIIKNKPSVLVNFGDSILNVTLVDYNEKMNQVEILGNKQIRTKELKGGFVKDLEEVQMYLKNALLNLSSEIGREDLLDEGLAAICTISSSLGERLSSNAMLSFLNEEIVEENVDKLIRQGVSNCNFPNEVVVMNYKAMAFKVDGVSITNPLGMSGKTLEVDLEIQTIDKNHYNNFKKIISNCGMEVDFIHFDVDNLLEGVLEEEDRDYGSVLVEFGLEKTRLVFVKREKIIKSMEIPQSANSIVKKIAEQYGFKYLEAHKLYENIGMIFEISLEGGFFEVEKSSMEIQRISLKELEQIINDGLEDVMEQIKVEVLRNKESIKYKNGIVFLNNTNLSQNIDKIINNVFSDDIITLKDNEVIFKMDKKVENANAIRGKFDIYGDVKFVKRKKNYQFDHDGEKYMSGKKLAKKRLEILDLEHMKDFGSMDKKEKRPSSWDKVKKTIIELW